VPLLLLGCVAGAPVPARATWFLDGDAAIVYETNLGLAQKARDVQSDGALATAVSGGRIFVLDDRNVLSLSADVTGTGYAQLGGLSNITVGLTPAFRSKFGLGAQAPWLKVWGTGGRFEFEDSVRDSWRYRVGAGIGKRFGERWDLRLDYTFEQRMADHARRVTPRLPGDVFDTTAHTVSGRVDFLYNETLSLFGAYAWREGDVVSTTRRNTAIFTNSKAVTPDPAFGPDFFAYKIDATVHMLTFGMSFAVTDHLSANFGYERQIGLGRGGLDYSNDVFRAGVILAY
jgi:hypothetical protein